MRNSVTGAPVPGITVKGEGNLYFNQPSTVTDANGYYSFDASFYGFDTVNSSTGLTAFNNALGASVGVTAAYFSSGVQVPAGQPIPATKDINLIPRNNSSVIVITGRVTDLVTGQPIAGARINNSSTNVTDSNGYYQFNGAQISTLTGSFYFVKTGYFIGTTSYNIGGALPYVVNVALRPGGPGGIALQGTVRDFVTGAPLPGLTVRSDGHWGYTQPSAVTDVNGYYSFDASLFLVDAVNSSTGLTVNGSLEAHVDNTAAYFPSGNQFVGAGQAIPATKNINLVSRGFIPTTTIRTNPNGLNYTVDGVTYSSQQTFNWAPGSTHTISVNTNQVSPDTRYIFTNWSNGGQATQTIFAPYNNTIYNANLKLEYLVTTNVIPSGGGTITPSGWFTPGSVFQVAATPNTNYTFDSFSGDLSGSTNPQNLVVGGPRTITANFKLTDNVPPSISCGVSDGLWHGSNTSINCQASDAGSGLANPDDTNFVLTTNITAGNETANASTNSYQVCDNVGNCASAGPIGGNMIDLKGSEIAINSPVDGAVYPINQSVTANFSCADGGSGVAACNGTVASGSLIDTGTLGIKTFIVNSTDNAGNTSSKTVSYKVVDNMPPSIVCNSADALWHSSNVTINCQATDTGSGLVNSSDANFVLSTNVAAGNETSNASTDSRQVCDVAGNCATAGPISGNKVDLKAPMVIINSPANNATYLRNQVVVADYSCPNGGSDLAACNGTFAKGTPIETGTTGTKTFIVTGTDNVGNSSSQTVTYTVVNNAPPGTASADLAISMNSDAPNRGVTNGTNVTYTITVVNGGPDSASNVVVSNNIPSGMSFVSATTSQGTIETPSAGATSGGIVARLGNLANESTVTITIVLKVSDSASGMIINDAGVQSATLDPKNNNNTVNNRVRVM